MPHYHGSAVGWANRLVRTPRVDFGRIKYFPGGSCGPRRQRDFQLVLLQSGAAEVTVDQATCRLQVDQIALFLPGGQEYYAFAGKQPTEHAWCSIRPDFMPAELRRSLRRAPRVLQCSEMMHRLFAAAQSCSQITSRLNGRVVEQIGLALFSEFLHLAAQAPERVQRDEQLSRAMSYMEEHYGEEHCLRQARLAAGCSESGLNQRFRKCVGTSPARYLWKIRVERGVALLRNTGLTVAEVSARCGCKNPFHFSRLVKGSHGASPRKVRRLAWR